MKETVQRLANLQAVDSRIAALKAEIEEIPRKLGETAARREVARTAVKTAEGKLESLEHERREREGELQIESERLRKYKTQLYQIKTNKEYTAMLHEIEATEKRIGDLEEKILVAMVGIDEAKAALSEAKRVTAKEEESCEEEEKALRSRGVEAERELGEREAERVKLAQSLEPGVLKRYAQIQSRVGALAVVEARRGTCQACAMELRPQLYNELFKGESLLACPSCERILYVVPEGEDSKSK
jgi:predicted  nucleic acid-binding Zn-ribbon protein